LEERHLAGGLSVFKFFDEWGCSDCHCLVWLRCRSSCN
jgi:Uri superfamily endonuclease